MKKEEKLDENILHIALAGNPNTGKSTIFNALTGAHQHVGNWPGVTVEKKTGRFTYNDQEIEVTDLPGTYGLSAYSIDERIARDFLVKNKPDVTVIVVDSTNLERNLYLATSILELGGKIVLDLNMSDMAESKNIIIDTSKIGKIFHCQVVRTDAFHGRGIKELKEAIVNTAHSDKKTRFFIDYSEDVEKEIPKIEKMLESESLYPARFLATRLLEGDQEIVNFLRENGENHVVEESLHIARHLERKFGYDMETWMIERRYDFIEGVLKECVKENKSSAKELTSSDKVDKILTNRFLGIPIFLVVMWATFEATFTIGGWLADYVDIFFTWLSEITAAGMGAVQAPTWLISLLTDGIIGGVGTVLVFLPNIMILFLAIAILEDSGYMARAAFVMDKLMHAIGLHGKSFIPMIIGFGCNVPAIMSTRTLSSEKDRILTILINPFMSCSARLPIYILFTSIFFKSHQGLIVFSLYLLGIVVAILSAKILKPIFFRHETAPLIMELPPYRLPTMKVSIIHMWERSSAFLKKAGTVIVVGVVLVWFLSSFPTSAEYASQQTLIGHLGMFLAPIFKPAGFGFWQAAVSLFFGVIAKETVVGTMGTLFGGAGKLAITLPNFFTPLSAYSFMIMSLLYIPCIATIGAIYKETNWKWALFSVLYSLLVGWTFAVAFYQIGNLFIR
jgi:ferrous iron transport protein B